MDSTPKRKPGRPRVRPIKPPPSFKRQKSLAETSEELVRWEVTLYQHQIAKIQSAAAAAGISRPEALRRMIDEWEPTILPNP